MIINAIMAILGCLSGGVLRLAPEAFKFADRSAERKHELAMQDKALEFERLRTGHKLDQVNAISSAVYDAESLSTLKAAIQGQSQITGVKWVDALSATVRPVITYWMMGLFCFYKTAAFFIVYHTAGLDMALALTWTEADYAILGDILSFWFLGRVLEKKSHAGT
jgi:hypothetical protein